MLADGTRRLAFSPQGLAVIYQAFDEAPCEIGHHFGDEPKAIERVTARGLLTPSLSSRVKSSARGVGHIRPQAIKVGGRVRRRTKSALGERFLAAGVLTLGKSEIERLSPLVDWMICGD